MVGDERIGLEAAAKRISALQQRERQLREALELHRSVRTEADAILSGEISNDWADYFGPLFDLMSKADSAYAALPAAKAEKE